MNQAKEAARTNLVRVKAYLTALLKWGCLAILIGSVSGLVGVAFHHAVDWAGEQFHTYDWLLYCLPLAGLAIVGLYHAVGIRKDRGTNLVLKALHEGETVTPRVAPLIFVGTVLTHLCGGSSGREGAALQIGAGVAACFSRLFKLGERDVRLATMCGMTALFSAVFGTPVTAALFAMEVFTVGVLRYTALYPCLLSSLTAWQVSSLLGGKAVRFTLLGAPEAGLLPMLQVAGLAILCALVSILFLTTMHGAKHLYSRLFKNQYLRVVVGGCLVIAMTLLLGSRTYNGAGMDVVGQAVAGQAVPWAFLVKILMTALTIEAGFKGGEIVPTFFIGATLGCTVGPLLGLDPAFAAAIGLVAMFCAVVNCPVASLMLAVELFGGEGLLLFALGCGVSYLMSGYYTLYAEQRIVHSKVGVEPKI